MSFRNCYTKQLRQLTIYVGNCPMLLYFYLNRILQPCTVKQAEMLALTANADWQDSNNLI